MNIGELIKCISANVQGIQTEFKRKDVLSYMINTAANIICLQDVHLKQCEENFVKNFTKGDCYISGNRTNARGVAIIFQNNFEYKIENVCRDTAGNFIVIDIKLSEISLRLINVYAPNTDSPEFFMQIQKFIFESEQDYAIVCGDFNLTLDPSMDSQNYININNPKARNVLIDTIEICDLIDTFRYKHPDTRRYTWRRKHPIKQARLDYFLASKTLVDLIDTAKIKPGYKSDHSIIEINIILNHFVRGRGVWKLNCDLLKDIEYVNMVNDTITQEKLTYALPVYNVDYVKAVGSDLIYSINDHLFLETLLMKIRGESIKHSSIKKKNEQEREKKLIKDIEILENTPCHFGSDESLNSKKNELVKIRENTLKGHIIRSRTQWLADGEKPTKYFCSLEHQKYIDKTIKKLISADGSFITTQDNILKNVREFYLNLFSNKDDKLLDVNLDSLFKEYPETRLTLDQSKNLEGLLTIDELSNSLMKMKNNKTPGIDGFPAEFFKVFWVRLKNIVLRSINYSFKLGNLSTTMRQCIINCIPKGNKPREYLKNWRPISLINVTYKLASSSIANRIKQVLPIIISPAQSGFVDGRFIGDTTRLVYDIMCHAETVNIDGLLMLIDFEKAFDSVSWKFMYKVFNYFGFGSDIIKWIKIFNTDISATILQMGVLSNFFPIKRGCKQGDPIASIEFIICVQILHSMIMNNVDIKGISYKNAEFKLSQFADDTTIFLDGSQNSLQGALNTIEVFGSYSGLKMNTSKTKLIWIGRKKYSKDKLHVSEKLEWGDIQFILLGITFHVDLNKMPSINYQNARLEILKIIEMWNKRYLTPIGKITIIKTYLLSKLNHLFMSIPSPNDAFYKDINNIFYKFIWDNKPDKVKRIQINQNYVNGGLKMIDLEKFVTAMKCTWIRRLLSVNKSQWKDLFEITISSIRNLTIFGSFYINEIITNIQNNFWQNVLTCWDYLSKKYKTRNNTQLLSTPLWKNPRISNTPLYLPNWFKNKIYFVTDIINQLGSVMNINELNLKYPTLVTNFLEHHRVKKLVEKYIQNNDHDGSFIISLPLIPHHVELVLKNKKGCKDMYIIQIDKNLMVSDQKFKQKWNDELNIHIDYWTWKRIFKICFSTIQDHKIIWFQYRILHRILGIRYLRYKMKIEKTPICNQCRQSDQTMLHLFTECPTYISLWKSLLSWVKNKSNVIIIPSPMNILLGYLNVDSSSNPINTILLIMKYYIFRTSLEEKKPNLSELQNLIKVTYMEQLLLAKLNDEVNNFNKNWSKFTTMLQN